MVAVYVAAAIAPAGSRLAHAVVALCFFALAGVVLTLTLAITLTIPLTLTLTLSLTLTPPSHSASLHSLVWS